MSAARQFSWPTNEPNAETGFSQTARLEMLGRLVGGVTHDFNNLLTGILLYCDLLLVELEVGSRVRKYAEEIRGASVAASGLVRQLLTVATPQSASPQPVSLNDVAEGMKDLLRRMIGDEVELEFRLDPELGLIHIDPAQVRQILLNLVLNSRDALRSRGRITVETRNCKVQIVPHAVSPRNPALEAAVVSLPCVLFVVSDDGHGMNAETRQRMFEAFFTTKPAGKGSGLGLATVHDIVTANGGLIHVDSSPGQGTRVSILLPLIPDEASRAARGDSPIPSAPSSSPSSISGSTQTSSTETSSTQTSAARSNSSSVQSSNQSSVVNSRLPVDFTNSTKGTTP